MSKQIKLLEEQLDCQLFLRKGPQLVLTKQAERMLDTVSSAMDTIRVGIANLRRTNDTTLTVTVLPSFTSYWLLPRLAEFESRHPDINVRLASAYTNIDFSINTDIDAGIRLGLGSWPGLHAEQITRDRMCPVCVSALAKSIKTVADLQHQRIFVDPHPYDDWERLFAASDQPNLSKERRYYDDSGARIRGALDGQGACLLREELILDYLASGALVRLFDVEFISAIHYWFVCPPARLNDTKIVCFRNWLMEHATH